METFFYLSFQTKDGFEVKNRPAIDIAKMLRERKDKVENIHDYDRKELMLTIFRG